LLLTGSIQRFLDRNLALFWQNQQPFGNNQLQYAFFHGPHKLGRNVQNHQSDQDIHVLKKPIESDRDSMVKK